MTALNAEHSFKFILAGINEGQTKTTHQLRLILDDLAEQFNATPLSLLVSFREWLLSNDIELSTIDGVVAISQAT